MNVIYLTEPKKAAPDKKSYSIGAVNSLPMAPRRRSRLRLMGRLQLPERPDIRRTSAHRHATQLNRRETRAAAIEMLARRVCVYPVCLIDK